jgi:gluconolactonase
MRSRCTAVSSFMFRPGALGVVLLVSACGTGSPGGSSGGTGASTSSAGTSSGAGRAAGGSAGSAASAGKSAGGTTSGAGQGGSGATTGGAGGAGATAGVAAGGSGGVGGGAGGAPGGSGGVGGGAGGAPGGSGGVAGAAGGMPGGSGGAGSGGDAGSGAAGSGAGAGSGGWTCPSGMTGTPTLTGTPTRIASVPPADAFNMNNGNFGNVEGPVWIGDALYVSEMSYMAYDSTNTDVKQARILKVTSDGKTSIAIADSGSNGLAVDANDNIVAAVHKDGSITRFALPAGTPTQIAGMFMGKRFDSPNDLVIHSNGTIYFTDPDFQAPATRPQSATRAYRIPVGGQPETIPSSAAPDSFGNPNGITLSLAEDFLYVAAYTGRRYPVMADGSLGAGTDFAALSGGDGVTIDCAGNIYVAVANTQTVKVYKPDGSSIGTLTVPEVQAATNVAFGGADHKTLYITGLGNAKGLFQINLSIPGRPY